MIKRGLELKLGTLTFLRNDGKALMLHRNKNPDDFLYKKYVAPGGKIENGETTEQCAKREFKEETGLELISTKHRGTVLFDNRKRKFGGKPAKFNFLVYIFEATQYHGQLENPENGTLEWVPSDRLKELPIEKGDSFIFDWMESEEFFSYKIILSDNDAIYETFDLE